MIMIVTHREDMRDQMSRYLRAQHHEVCVPAHRPDVIAMMCQERPSLVILDLYVKDPSGASVLRTLREEGYTGRILVLSGLSMSSVLKDAYPTGVDEVMQLPANIGGTFDFAPLGEAIKHHPS